MATAEPDRMTEFIARERAERCLHLGYLKVKAYAAEAKAAWQAQVKSNERWRGSLLETFPLFDGKPVEADGDRPSEIIADLDGFLAEQMDAAEARRKEPLLDRVLHAEAAAAEAAAQAAAKAQAPSAESDLDTFLVYPSRKKTAAPLYTLKAEGLLLATRWAKQNFPDANPRVVPDDGTAARLALPLKATIRREPAVNPAAAEGDEESTPVVPASDLDRYPIRPDAGRPPEAQNSAARRRSAVAP